MAHDAISLSAQNRTDFGKGASRRARREGLVPAVVYGHGSEPRHILLPGHDTALALRGNDNALVELELGSEKLLALTKAVQRHPIRPGVQHVDFQLVNRTERVDVEVPVAMVGEGAPGTMQILESAHLLVSAPAVSIPEVIEVDITGVEAGTVITVADMTMPKGVEALVDAEAAVVNVTEETVAPEPEAEASEGGAEAEAAPASEAE